MENGESAGLQFTTPGLRLTGSGAIVGDIEVAAGGLIAPGANYGAGTGSLSIVGKLVLGDSAVVDVGIGGLSAGSQHDQLQASGSIELGGDLHIALVNPGGGFQPPMVGDEYTLISAQGGITGSFQNAASLSSIGAGSLVDWALEQEQNRLILKAMAVTQLVAGDYNADGKVDTADYVLWRNSVGSVNLAADGNRDGQIDQLDYQVWRAHVGEAAASAAARSSLGDIAVPEPASAMLLLIAAAGSATVSARSSRPARSARKQQYASHTHQDDRARFRYAR
jgi:hypothetical protein